MDITHFFRRDREERETEKFTVLPMLLIEFDPPAKVLTEPIEVRPRGGVGTVYCMIIILSDSVQLQYLLRCKCVGCVLCLCHCSCGVGLVLLGFDLHRARQHSSLQCPSISPRAGQVWSEPPPMLQYVLQESSGHYLFFGASFKLRPSPPNPP